MPNLTKKPIQNEVIRRVFEREAHDAFLSYRKTILKVKIMVKFNSCGRKSNFLWKLYEKTLKIIIDSILERWWPK
jgi:hypothetical protein